MHARAATFVDAFSVSSLQRIFGDMPGGDRLAKYLQNRARKELGKLDESTLEQYLTYLAAIMSAVKTGENFEQILELARQTQGQKEAA